MPDSEQRISLDPEPPVRNQDVEISYDFTGLDMKKTRLRVTFYPGGTPTIYTIEKDDPRVAVPVPGDATSVLIEDLDGPSPDKSSSIAHSAPPAP